VVRSPPSVRRPARLQQRLLAVAACVFCAGAITAAGGADTPSTLRQRADELRHANATLSARQHEALLGLYALDAQLERAQARIDALGAERQRIEDARASVSRQLGAAQTTLRASQRQLALRLHALYETGGTDPLAVLLGATSVRAAITGLDELSRSAKLDQRIANQAHHARTRLQRLARRLAARDAELAGLTDEAELTLSALRATRAARERFVGEMAGRQRLNQGQISQLEAHARVSAARSQALAAASRAAPVSAVAAEAPATAVDTAVPGGRTVTVVATGYSLPGRTAIGIPVGWGVVAVDPALFPLGTRMTIPGYGEGIAADTGSAVRGAVIDLWFPSNAHALGWGRRTVTITLH
jgi:3D (Asp-Asp-Asp) domain-containing protein